MKSPTTLFLVVSLAFLITGCEFAEKRGGSPKLAANQVAVPSARPETKDYMEQPRQMRQVSLNDATASEKVSSAIDRKIIRNADLTLEVTSPNDTQRQVSSIADANGGFVVTSESKQRESGDPAKRVLDIKLVMRLPATQFDGAVSSIEKLATHIIQENLSGEDVTEEFIDLEARIKTQKALEVQFLEIMRQATKVADALEVQRQIADVRTEIEKLEGRKRFLENHASLSTITVNLQAPVSIGVATTGFWRSVRAAISDSIDVASGIVLFLIRFIIVMIPILVFVVLPAGLLARYLVRRGKRIRLAQALHAAPSSE